MLVWAVLGALLSLMAPIACEPIPLNDADAGRRYDGHGGLSAGASSRLLYDYPAQQRVEILDILYKPRYGANLHMCKGVEASHMHTRSDLNYNRGYEYWLMSEAKKRNPDIATYALSWGTPGWIGNGSYFSADNIMYQTKFLEGARSQYNITLDYIGIWNEHYVKSLRQAFDAAGFNNTKIVGADGSIPADQIAALQTDPEFSAAEPILGAHYPCNRDQPSEFWELTPPKVYWANEDFSTLGGDWEAASCWGRSLVQNYVKLNATSTISWSTIWSVYDSFRYFGNGLMYAFQPWSGNYTVPPAVWTSAHVTQFAQPGWRYLKGSGAGLLAGGGSYSCMVPGEVGSRDFSLILEKLEGKCLRCSVPATTAEEVQFLLAGALAGTSTLAIWLSNSTHQFIRLADLPVTDNKFTVTLPRDTILSITTTAGQLKGELPTPPTFQPFPFPYTTDYDADIINKPARYHADNGGCFEILPDSHSAQSGKGQHLSQTSLLYPSGTEWVGNYDPITSLGSTDWANYQVTVQAAVPDPAVLAGDPISGGSYVGVCVRQIDQYDTGVCLLVGLHLTGAPSAGLGWVIQAGEGKLQRSVGVILATGNLNSTFDLRQYHTLRLQVQDDQVTGWLDNNLLATLRYAVPDAVPPVGLASLRSGFHVACFDNLVIDGPQSSAFPHALFDKHLLWPPTPEPGGPIDKQAPSNTVSGLFGCSITPAQDLVVQGLGRFTAGLGSNQTHELALVAAWSNTTVASVTVNLAAANGGDLNGYAWATLRGPKIVLAAGQTYYLVSSETQGGDLFYPAHVQVQSRPGLLAGFPQPASNINGQWNPGNVEKNYSMVISRLTKRCLDRAGIPDMPFTRIDTWDCVDDHHNEMFRLDLNSGLLYVRSNAVDHPDLCVSMGPCPLTMGSSSACEVTCDSKQRNQTFSYRAADGTLRLKSDVSSCITTAGTPAEDAPLTLTPCAAQPSAAQQWDFVAIPGSAAPADWGQCYGPVNLLIEA